MSRDKMDLLRAFLGSLPAGLADRVARAVEVDRMNDGKALPHDMILESLRPTLRAGDQSGRAQTPMRLFCRPFEDLLTNEQRVQKQKGRIHRSSITPVWNWLAQDLLPEALNAYSLAVKTAAISGNTDELMDRAVEFWKTAAETLGGRLASESGRRAARQPLGSDAAAEDAREMAIMLAAGPDMCALQDCFPNIVPSLTDEHIALFREAYEQVQATAPDAAAYMALIVMKRLEKPWEALRLPLSVSHPMQETLIANTDMGLVGEILFAAIESHGAAIRAAKLHQFNADAMLAHLEEFTALSGGVVKEVELRRDGVWGQRLVKDRAAVAEVMDGFMERASKEIMAALPHTSASHASSPPVPDMGQPADPEKSDRALSYARLVAGCRPFAAAASFGASLKRANDEIEVALKNYNEEIVRDLRHAGEDERINAEQYAAVATELTAILFSPEESEHLRRRGRAAAASSMAA
jgi:hypothetical protein